MKAVVMETKGRKAAVLLKDGTFRITHGKYRVGEIIDYREEVSVVRRWAAVAAAIAVGIGIGCGFWYDSNLAVYGEVSIDAAPSIVYEVNRKNQVLSVKALNNEAEEVVSMLNEENVHFMPVSEAVEKTLEVFESEGYLDEEREDYVLVSVSADSKRRDILASEVEEGMQSAADMTIEYTIDQTDRETAKKAAENNMSTGRYTVWEASGDKTDPSAYASRPMSEIMGNKKEDAGNMPQEKNIPDENNGDGNEQPFDGGTDPIGTDEYEHPDTGEPGSFRTDEAEPLDTGESRAFNPDEGGQPGISEAGLFNPEEAGQPDISEARPVGTGEVGLPDTGEIRPSGTGEAGLPDTGEIRPSGTEMGEQPDTNERPDSYSDAMPVPGDESGPVPGEQQFFEKQQPSGDAPGNERAPRE